MLERYLSEAMAAVFSNDARYARWRQVEVAVIDAYAAAGYVTAAAADAVKAAACPTAFQVAEREQVVRHDVVAFLSAWTATMPDNASSVVHRGLTSSDVVDTALALQLASANALLLDASNGLFRALRAHALAHRHTVRVGRTHGQIAAVDVWGHRVADFAFAADRARSRLVASAQAVAIAKLSGPTGAYHEIPPQVEAEAATLLGLLPVDAASQIVMRDRLAEWMCSLALAVSVCEGVALEIRLGQHAGVGELAEASSHVQAGSSAMPHKRNPITAERICGLARVVRGYVTPIMEGVALWHERDLSHSSVERICIPDAAALTEHVLVATTGLIEDVQVHVDQMSATVDHAGASLVTHTALALLADAGVGWQQAWNMVRDASRDAEDDSQHAFATRLAELARHAGISWGDTWTAALTGKPAHAYENGPARHLDGVFARLNALPAVVALPSYTARRPFTRG